MFAIHKGNVPTYQGGSDALVYLVSNLDLLVENELDYVITDRNAVLEIATFSEGHRDIDQMVDWELMEARYWHNTEEDPARRERRMAECLVHCSVPWTMITEVHVHTDSRRSELIDLAGPNIGQMIHVTPGWYF